MELTKIKQAMQSFSQDKSISLLKKLSFPLRISLVNVIKSAVQFPADLATLTEEILNEKLH